MRHFSTHETARILEATETQVRSWARLGQIVPRRGPGLRLEFDFQELLLLRTTKGLVEAGVPTRRLRRIWSSLRRQLGAGLPLTSISIFADGHRAVAWDGAARWQPDSGQFLLALDAGDVAERAEVGRLPDSRAEAAAAIAASELEERIAEPPPDCAESEHEGVVALAGGGRPRPGSRATPRATTRSSRGAVLVVEEPPAVLVLDRFRGRIEPDDPATDPEPQRPIDPDAGGSTVTAEQWFELAGELEGASPLEARQAYHQALERDPDFADAHLNLGRLYHEAGELGKAEAHYRSAVRCDPADPTGHFNLGVLLDDRGRRDEAVHAYQQAIARDPENADAHYNLGLVLEALGRRGVAMTHLMEARRLYALGHGD